MRTKWSLGASLMYFLILVPRRCATSRDIQNDVLFSSLISAGCSACYLSGLTSRIAPQNSKTCTGPYYFIGVKSSDDDKLDFGTYAAASDIPKRSYFGVIRLFSLEYWYLNDGRPLDLFDGLEITETHELVVRNNLRSEELRSEDIRGGLENYPSKWIFNCPDILDFRNLEESLNLASPLPDDNYTAPPSATAIGLETLPSSQPTSRGSGFAAPKLYSLPNTTPSIVMMSIAPMAFILGIFMWLNPCKSTMHRIYTESNSEINEVMAGDRCLGIGRLLVLAIAVILLSPFILIAVLWSVFWTGSISITDSFSLDADMCKNLAYTATATKPSAMTGSQRQEISRDAEVEEMEDDEEEVEADMQSVEEGRAEKEGFSRTNSADDRGAVIGIYIKTVAPLDGYDNASI